MDTDFRIITQNTLYLRREIILFMQEKKEKVVALARIALETAEKVVGKFAHTNCTKHTERL
jgi:hypothetical protein